MSSPPNIHSITRTQKANLTVASLINCTNISRNQVLSTSEKLLKEDSSLPTITSKSTNVGVVQNSHSLPTVANTELLYKSVTPPNSNSTPPPLAPTSPATATLTVKKPYTNIIGSCEITSSENPLTHIKTLTNIITTPHSKLDTIQINSNSLYTDIKPVMATNINVSIQPPQTVTAESSLVSLLTANPSIVVTTSAHSLNMASTPTSFSGIRTGPPLTVNQQVQQALKTSPTTVGNLVNQVVKNPSTILKKDILNSAVNKTTVPLHKQNGQALPAVFVPRGWNRLVEKDYITYIRYEY